MKKLIVLILVLVFCKQSYTQQAVNTTLSSPSMTNLYYSNVTNGYYTGGSNLWIGQCDINHNSTSNGPIFNYVLIVFDLDQDFGGMLNSLNSGSVTVSLDGSYGSSTGYWQAGIITTDVSNSSAQVKINAIRNMSYSQAHSSVTSINLTLSIQNIVNNKIIVGVRRDNAGLKMVSSCSATINGTILRSATLNVTYNQGTGNIVAYSGSYSAPTAPAQVTAYETNTIHIAPLSPTIPGYQLVYNENQAPLNKSEWRRKDGANIVRGVLSPASNSFALLKSEDGWKYEAQMKKWCNVTLSAYGGIVVNGTTCTSPQSRQIVEGNTLTAGITTQMYTSNNINYYFSQWSNGSTSQSTTFTINSTQTITANYLGYAYTPNVHFDGDPGDFITIDWDDHPNTAVTQYQVWRMDPNHPSGVLLTTKSRGNTNYTDPDYSFYQAPGTALNLKYAVIAKYSTDDT